MIKMNAIDFENLLKTITYRWFQNLDNENLYKLAGVNPDHWIDCEAKTILREFIFLSKTKSRSFAKSMLGPKILSFDIIDHDDDYDKFKVTYHFNLKRHKAINLARSLQANPDAADDILTRYTANQSDLIETRDFEELVSQAILDNERRIKEKSNLVILPGFELLSNAISGFNPQRISMVGAISGFGKTKLAVNLAIAASKTTRTIYFNMEMGYTDFAAMFIQKLTGITQNEWTKGHYLNASFAEKTKKIINENYDLQVTNGKSLTIDQISSVAMALTSGYDKSLIIVDYDQKIISNERGEEWQQMLKTIVRLEDLAKITNSHVLVLYQADDDGKIKSSKRAAQPASCVLSFYKEDNEYYIKSTKNRFGPPFRLKVDYKPEVTQISEIEMVEHEKKLERMF